jgi:hypothetical protein
VSRLDWKFAGCHPAGDEHGPIHLWRGKDPVSGVTLTRQRRRGTRATVEWQVGHTFYRTLREALEGARSHCGGEQA